MIRFNGSLGSRRLYATWNQNLGRRSHKSEVQQPKSHVQTKLNYFRETGEIMRRTPKQYDQKKMSNYQRMQGKVMDQTFSSQKALLVLKSKYDSGLLQDSNGGILNLELLKPSDISPDSPTSLVIFQNLLHIKKVTKRNIDLRLLLALLGTNELQIKDPYLVTKDVLKLLERDRSAERAFQLAKLAGEESGIVGMNAVLQWYLEKGDVKGALKCFQERKKMRVPPNAHTYVILFDGLAKAHAWGAVPSHICQRSIEHFTSFRLEVLKELTKRPSRRNDLGRCDIEHFNSLLSLLVKNFDNDQELAWAFFNELIPDPKGPKLPILVPTIQTFTIFLNGIKEHAANCSRKVLLDKGLSSSAKSAKLYEIQSKLVLTADIILQKVIKAATPPVPPTKDEAEQNPQLLIDYRQSLRRQILDIDPTFVSVFVSCYINNWSGTGVDTKLGSHYRYIQQGLEYLKIWSPEAQAIFNFLNSHTKPESTTSNTKSETSSNTKSETSDKTKSETSTSPHKSVKYATDTRTQRIAASFPEYSKLLEVESFQEILPFETLPSEPLAKSKLNPLVTFPPPPLSKNKSKALFSNVQKPLVDFARPTHADIKKIVLGKQYDDSKGKYGKKLTTPLTTKRKPTGINRFLLLQIIDGLVKLGKNKEFYLTCWYILNKWGGINISKSAFDKITSTTSLREGILDAEQYPRFVTLNEPSTSPLPQLKHDESVVDIMLVENFMYKINENFHAKGLTGGNLVVELFAALVNPQVNVAGTLRPRYKTSDAVFASLRSDLVFYNNHDYNQQVQENKADKEKIPHKSITHEQLESFLPSLVKFMDSLVVLESQSSKQDKYLLPNMYIESYNKIIDRVYAATWVSVSEEQAINHHKQIIKSGILFYKPVKYINPVEKLQYSTPILRSMEIVYKYLKEKKDLPKEDIKLYLSLLSLFKLNHPVDEPLAKLDSISKAISRTIF